MYSSQRHNAVNTCASEKSFQNKKQCTEIKIEIKLEIEKQEQTNDDIKQVAVETPPGGRGGLQDGVGWGRAGVVRGGGVNLREETWKLLVCLSLRRDGAESPSLSCFFSVCFSLSVCLFVCLSVTSLSLSVSRE